MNAFEVIAANPKPTASEAQDASSAPEAADWLQHPDAVVERVTLAMQLANEPPYKETE
jgi:hypothetical protein